MPTQVRIATFNLENLDSTPGQSPTLDERIAVVKPQLLRLRPDILCLQEVNGQGMPGQPRKLEALDQLIKGTDLEKFNREHTKIQSSPGGACKERNLVILSRWQITVPQEIQHTVVEAPAYKSITQNPQPIQASDRTWERPIFYARIKTPGKDLHVINLHMKSRLPTNIEGQNFEKQNGQDVKIPWKTVFGWAEGCFISSMKRVGQAIETRAWIDQLFAADPEAFIVVCGDFNGEIDDVPVQAIRGDVADHENPAHVPFVMIPCELTVPGSARYSLIHHGKGCMFDHLLASRQLFAHYRGTEIHNELVHDESVAFAVDKKFPESDHAPVVAEFELPDPK